MHPAWQRVSYAARSLGRDLFSVVEDFGSMQIPTSGEWQSSLCMTLCVNGRNDRRNARVALATLEAAGLITVGPGWVTVNVQPRCAHGALTVLPSSHSRVVNSNQVVETIENEPDRREENRQEEKRVERERDPAPTELAAKEQLPPWRLMGEHYADLFDEAQRGSRLELKYPRHRIRMEDAQKFLRLYELAKLEANARGLVLEVMFEGAVRCFLANEYQRSKGYVLNFFLSDFGSWVDRGLVMAVAS